MKIAVILSIGFLFCITTSCGLSKIKARPVDGIAQTSGTVYDFKMESITGKMIDFSVYRGNKLLIVNTASECDFTPQYADLQELNDKYGNEVIVLGFPANNFGGQEPGTNSQIATFCKENYGVTFQIFKKISVKGDDMAPLYQWLSDKSKNGWNEVGPNWNFCKYLINEQGELKKFYASAINPMGEEILNDILK